jgi:hypothetical protein
MSEFGTLLKTRFPETNKWPGKDICIAFANVNDEWYETRQAISFSSETALKGISGMIIRFVSTRKAGSENNACFS